MSRNARSRMGRAIKAAPSFSLDFTKGVLDPRLTFTRASGATFVGSGGLLQTAASNAPRFDYDPVTLAIRGLLIEEARTNLCVTSSGYVTGNTTETAVDAVTRAANRTGIDGVTNSESTYTEGVGTATHGLFLTSPIAYTSGTTYTTSVVFTALGATRVQMTFGSAAFGAAQYANFGLTGAGSVLASAGCAATIVPLGNSRYRCSTAALATATTGGPPTIVAFINSDTATRLPSYTGSGTLTLGVFGMQTEAGAFPTSIIPTSGAAATRAAETCTNGTNQSMLPWFNPKEGTTWVEYVSFASVGVSTRAFTIRNSPGTNALNCANSSGGALVNQKTANSAVSSCTTRAAYTPNTLFRAANSYDSAIMYGASNGAVNGAGSTTTAPFSGGDLPGLLDIGSQGSASQLNGWIRGFQYFPVALPLRELQRLTTLAAQPTPSRINPDFSLHFLDGVLDSRITFTRASSGTRINSAGVLVTETTNAPRFDHDPVTLACKGLLIEEARTNLVAVSRSAWGAAGAATGAYTAAGSDGAANVAYLVAESTASSQQVLVAPTVSFVSGTTYTLSVLAKPGTVSRMQVSGAGAVFGTAQYANFSMIGAGSVLASAGITASGIRPAGNGFYHCWVTLAATATTTGNGVLATFINSDTATRNPVYVGNASNTLILDHAQTEVGAFPTSIIPTSGAAATRAADVATVTGANFSSWFNQQQGTAVAQFRRDAISATALGANARVVALRQDSSNESAIMCGTSSPSQQRWSVTVGGSVVASLNAAAAGVAGAVQKISASYAQDNFQAAQLGVAMTPDTAGALPSPVTLELGSSGSSAQLNGYLQHFDYYRQALPADFITELSR